LFLWELILSYREWRIKKWKNEISLAISFPFLFFIWADIVVAMSRVISMNPILDAAWCGLGYTLLLMGLFPYIMQSYSRNRKIDSKCWRVFMKYVIAASQIILMIFVFAIGFSSFATDKPGTFHMSKEVFCQRFGEDLDCNWGNGTRDIFIKRIGKSTFELSVANNRELMFTVYVSDFETSFSIGDELVEFKYKSSLSYIRFDGVKAVNITGDIPNQFKFLEKL
jgi:hypothetical protein